MNFWHEKLKIKNLSFPRFIGGPVDGMTDSPYRQLIRSFSPDALLYTEIRHVRSVAHEQGGAKALRFELHERPLNFQFTANSLEGIELACEKVLHKGVECVDLNIGCPAKNIIQSGSGSALMADPALLKQIVQKMRALLPIPFTVKMRAGFKEVNAYDIAQMMQDCGVDAIAVHPRLQKQRFSGEPAYDLVAAIKKSVSIPLLFSGGIVDWESAQQVHALTGVDGFLVSRGLYGAPWKLQELHELSQGRAYALSLETRIVAACDHLDLLVNYYGPAGVYPFRKHISYYLAGLPDATIIGKTCMETEDVNQVKLALQTALKKELSK
jgi:tRNA-dihydrouridine synthase B